MRSLALAVGATAFISFFSFVGCGSHPRSVTPVCAPPARAGCSLPKTRSIAPPTAGARVPDASEYQGCPSWTGPVIFKVYEGGYGQDHAALCNARRVHKLHLWAGVYAFLRPAHCAGQGYATAQIVRQLGGVRGPVIADAEVALPRGCVEAFLAAVRKGRSGPTDIYTAPGTWPGGRISAPLWVATYGPRPGCVEGVCSHVAWQFSSTARCGPIVGDCSLDNGITKQRRVDVAKLIALRNQIRHLRLKYRCAHGPTHKHVPVCRYWTKVGNRVNAEIARA